MIAALVLGVVLAVVVWRLSDRAEAVMVLGIAAVLAAWIYGEVSRPAVHAAAAPDPVPTRTVVVHAAPAPYHGPNGLEITIIVIVAIVFVVGASIAGAWIHRERRG
jgi:hypothetical protein